MFFRGGTEEERYLDGWRGRNGASKEEERMEKKKERERRETASTEERRKKLRKPRSQEGKNRALMGVISDVVVGKEESCDFESTEPFACRYFGVPRFAGSVDGWLCPRRKVDRAKVEWRKMPPLLPSPLRSSVLDTPFAKDGQKPSISRSLKNVVLKAITSKKILYATLPNNRSDLFYDKESKDKKKESRPTEERKKQENSTGVRGRGRDVSAIKDSFDQVDHGAIMGRVDKRGTACASYVGGRKGERAEAGRSVQADNDLSGNISEGSAS
ncbi:hypothetical protein KM043_006418 [Ampulex compressa]|nr:hypothetical protein KM043_006418 [Ampulex compressa]